jgi:TfoX/Sxy family transcriptional regulator of competence genes
MKTIPFLEHILYDIFDEQDMVTARAMMGAYMLYSEGKPFALVEDDQLWLKGSDELAEWYLERGAEKFRVSRSRGLAVNRSGKVQELNYFSVPEEILEDREAFKEWVDVALTVATLPKAKKSKV